MRRPPQRLPVPTLAFVLAGLLLQAAFLPGQGTVVIDMLYT